MSDRFSERERHTFGVLSIPAAAILGLWLGAGKLSELSKTIYWPLAIVELVLLIPIGLLMINYGRKRWPQVRSVSTGDPKELVLEILKLLIPIAIGIGLIVSVYLPVTQPKLLDLFERIHQQFPSAIPTTAGVTYEMAKHSSILAWIGLLMAVNWIWHHPLGRATRAKDWTVDKFSFLQRSNEPKAPKAKPAKQPGPAKQAAPAAPPARPVSSPRPPLPQAPPLRPSETRGAPPVLHDSTTGPIPRPYGS